MRWVLVAAAFAASCKAPPAPAPPPAEQPAATKELAPEAAPPSSSVTEPLHTYDRPVADAHQWLVDHGVSGSVMGETCFEVDSGMPPAPGLLCRAPPSPRSRQTVERLYRVDGKRMAQVYEGTVGIYANWVDLVVQLDSDGARLVLKDRKRCLCEEAEEEDRLKTESQVQPDWLSRDLYAACKARGAYRWSGATR